MRFVFLRDLLFVLFLSVCSWGNAPTKAIAQSINIRSAGDEVNTLVQSQNNQFDITGGQLSSDGQNLFHSFSDFNLNQGEIANFLSPNSNLQNIISRINGGNPSYLNGLLQVTGSNANLFLLNPAGLFFGANASLNVSGDFIASTATSLGFPNGNLFQVIGANDYSNLVGYPFQFNFANDLSNVGAIINEAHLTVQPGQTLGLFGGSLVNVGSLTAPRGSVLLATTTQKTPVILRTEGHLLALEVDLRLLSGDRPPFEFRPVMLPGLLTGSESSNQLGTIPPDHYNLPIPTAADLVKHVPFSSGLRVNASGLGFFQDDQFSLTNPGSIYGKGGSINASSSTDGGLISLSSYGNQILGNLTATGKMGVGGIIMADADAGIQQSGQSDVSSQAGDGGKIFLSASNALTVNDLSATSQTGDGGLIYLQSLFSFVNAQSGLLDTRSTTGQFGDIWIQAADYISTGYGLGDRLNGFPSLAPPSTSGRWFLISDTNVFINDPLVLDTGLEVYAGQSIFINADIDTSTVDGAITLIANNRTAEEPTITEMEPGVIVQQPGTTIRAGAGDIFVQLKESDEAGLIQLGDVQTSATVTLDAFNGRVFRSDPNAVITAGRLIVNGLESSGFGTLTAPLQFNPVTYFNVTPPRGGGELSRVTLLPLDPDTPLPEINLDGFAGTGGIFVQLVADPADGVNDLVVGDLSEDLFGLTTVGGDIHLFNPVGSIVSLDKIQTSIPFGMAGDVWLEAPNGDINTFGAPILATAAGFSNLKADQIWLESYWDGKEIITEANPSTGGNITLLAGGNIITGQMIAQGDSDSGDIRLISSHGGIDTVTNLNPMLKGFGNLDAYSPLGNGGNIFLQAQRDIVTAQLISEGGGDRSGDITVNSLAGGVLLDFREALFGPSSAISFNRSGQAGAIAVQGFGDVTVARGLDSAGNVGGAISLRSAQGRIDLTGGNVRSYGLGGDAGDVTLWAMGDLLSQDIVSYSRGFTGGNLDLWSEAGGANLGNLSSYGNLGIGGDVRVDVAQNLRLNNVFSYGDRASGDVWLRSRAGSIQTNNIMTIAPNGTSGNVFLNSLGVKGNILTANISSIGGQQAGDIILQSPNGSITTQNLASISQAGTSGAIQLTAQENITTQDITTQGATEQGDVLLASEQGLIRTGTVVGNARLAGAIAKAANVGQAQAQIFSVMKADQWITATEEVRQGEFANYFGRNMGDSEVNTARIQAQLQTIQREAGSRSAMIYVNFPETAAVKEQAIAPDSLEFMIFTADAEPVHIVVPNIPQDKLLSIATQLRILLTSRYNRNAYRAPAQKLYNWLIAPLDPVLQELDIDTLLFSLDSGLRGIPLAALFDGDRFLVEKYAIGMVPSFGLMDYGYQSLHNTEVLAMGASQFADLDPLPAVEPEVNVINQLWSGKSYLNEAFTRKNLEQARQTHPYPIIHLATHAEFRDGQPENSYIALWDDKLYLADLPELDWDDPQVELLVLSACRTASGSANAELGFAGLAVASGTRSALASLWSVSDAGTLVLMSEFYDHLRQTTVKAEALRQAQIAMIRGELSIQNGQLRSSKGDRRLQLPAELAQLSNTNLSHPYYWSGFTFIGSPW